MLEAMHNTKDLCKKYTSANLTFRNWAKRRGWVKKEEQPAAETKTGYFPNGIRTDMNF